ncbi:MAG: Nif3-like dinuclear metal center hexameric protein [Flavobacteriales bacterium]|nr:Nif3-like dinuclear metal center hexameric protein [Flavobacteriales bacterium]
MKLRELCTKLEEWAPLAYQESYDNSGLITGDPEQELKGVLVSLDCLENVVEEAIKRNCNVIVSHHPIVFKGLKSLTGKNYVERTVLKAIKNDIALYAIHTNLDNIHTGVSKMMADRLGLQNTKVLAPKNGLLKMLVTYVPENSAEKVRSALFAAGAGSLGAYSECNFSVDGTGTFKGSELSNPTIGVRGVREQVSEERIELVFPSYIESRVISTLKNTHPYEEVAYSIVSIDNANQFVGSGMIGELPEPLNEMEFLKNLKEKLKTDCIRHTSLLNNKIKKVALCGGAGSSLLNAAKQSDADVFITGDFKYHEFFDAENSILIADIGHYESEQYTMDLIADFLRKNFPKFAVHLSKVNTNPINYL